MKRLCLDGARDRHRSIRRTCILMLPRLLIESEVREHANQLLLQETDPELCDLLNGMISDLQLEGTEDEKNRFLAPLPVDEQRVMDDGQSVVEQFPVLDEPIEAVAQPGGEESPLEEAQRNRPQGLLPEPGGPEARIEPDDADIGRRVDVDIDADGEPDWQGAIAAIDSDADEPNWTVYDDEED